MSAVRTLVAALFAGAALAACGGGSSGTGPTAASDRAPATVPSPAAPPAPGTAPPAVAGAADAVVAVVPTRASTSLALETHASGTRLWVANADGDTVAVMRADDGALEAEVVVGRAPRAVAVASDGRVWASVQDPPSLVVIDPATLRVVAPTWLESAA